MTPRFEQQVKPFVDMRAMTPDDKVFKIFSSRQNGGFSGQPPSGWRRSVLQPFGGGDHLPPDGRDALLDPSLDLAHVVARQTELRRRLFD